MVNRIVELVKPYIDEDDKKPEKLENFFYIKHVPVSIARKLLRMKNGLNSEETQNSSPSMKELVELCEKFDGTLDGYVIPIESKRSDSRVTFDGITLLMTKLDAYKLQTEIEADDFQYSSEGSWFWWD